MKTLQRGVLAVLTVGTMLTLPALAAAPGSADDFTVRIRYDDLNIDSTAGARALYERMQYASARACNVESYRELGSLDRVREAHVCYARVLDDLVSKVDSEKVQKLHES